MVVVLCTVCVCVVFVVSFWYMYHSSQLVISSMDILKTSLIGLLLILRNIQCSNHFAFILLLVCFTFCEYYVIFFVAGILIGYFWFTPVDTLIGQKFFIDKSIHQSHREVNLCAVIEIVPIAIGSSVASLGFLYILVCREFFSIIIHVFDHRMRLPSLIRPVWYWL